MGECGCRLASAVNNSYPCPIGRGAVRDIEEGWITWRCWFSPLYPLFLSRPSVPLLNLVSAPSSAKCCLAASCRDHHLQHRAGWGGAGRGWVGRAVAGRGGRGRNAPNGPHRKLQRLVMGVPACYSPCDISRLRIRMGMDGLHFSEPDITSLERGGRAFSFPTRIKRVRNFSFDIDTLSFSKVWAQKV